MKLIKEIFDALEQMLSRPIVAVIGWGLISVLSLIPWMVWTKMDIRFALAIWAVVMSFSIRPFMVSVSEFTDLVTINLLTGGLKTYHTGLWFRYPWEQVKEGNYINLRLLPLGGDEDYPAKDGPSMHAIWQAPYRVIDAIKFIGVGKEHTEEIITKAGSSVLAGYIASHPAEEVKENHAKAEEELQKKFAAMKLEEMCGVEIPVVSIADLDYEPDVQKVRSSKYIADHLKKMANALQKKATNADGTPVNPEKAMSDSDALTNAMVIHGNATLNVNEVKGEGGNALAALFMGFAQGGKDNKAGGAK